MIYAYISWGLWLLSTVTIHVNIRNGGYPDFWSILSTTLAHVAIIYGVLAVQLDNQPLWLLGLTNIIALILYLAVMLKTRNKNG